MGELKRAHHGAHGDVDRPGAVAERERNPATQEAKQPQSISFGLASAFVRVGMGDPWVPIRQSPYLTPVD